MDDGNLKIPVPEELLHQTELLDAMVKRFQRERRSLPRAACQQQLLLLRRHADKLSAELERALVWDEAISLAFRERTGLELMREEEYSAVDAKRAAEIMQLYPAPN
jgi:hypothetical protein